jgi:hypothetical protein
MTFGGFTGTAGSGVKFLSWKDGGGSEHAIEAEFVITSWGDSRQGEVSRVPIEDGSEISDHYIQRPDTLEVEVVVSNQPYHPSKAVEWSQETLDVRTSDFVPHGLLALTSAIGGAVSALLGELMPLKVWVTKSKTESDYIGDFHDAIIKIKEGVFLCSLTFQDRVVSDLVIEKLGLRFSGDDTAATFKIEFSKIKKVETRVMGLPVPKALLEQMPKNMPKMPKQQSAAEAEVREHSKPSLLLGGVQAVLP